MVLRAGSFAAAGRQLGYTGSAVSQQMMALEAECGLTLFQRSAHGIRPTPAAELLTERAGDILGALASLEEVVREIATGTRGRLGLGCFPTASEVLVPDALARFARMFANVDVRFDDGEPESLLPRLVEGDLDLLVVYRYDLVPQGWPAGVRRTPLHAEAVKLLVPEDHRTRTRPAAPRRRRRRLLDLHAAGQCGDPRPGAVLRDGRVHSSHPLSLQRL